jgi:hypothetical protein
MNKQLLEWGAGLFCVSLGVSFGDKAILQINFALDGATYAVWNKFAVPVCRSRTIMDQHWASGQLDQVSSIRTPRQCQVNCVSPSAWGPASCVSVTIQVACSQTSKSSKLQDSAQHTMRVRSPLEAQETGVTGSSQTSVYCRKMVVNATQASQTGGDGNQNRTKTWVKAADDHPAAPILGREALERWNTRRSSISKCRLWTVQCYGRLSCV